MSRLAADLATLAAANARQAALDAIATCRLCDAAGWSRQEPTRRCDHPTPTGATTMTETHQARWRVSRDPVDADTIPLAGPWAVTSPRGSEFGRAWTQRQAFALAFSMAAIDGLLARVNVSPIAQRRPALAVIGGGR